MKLTVIATVVAFLLANSAARQTTKPDDALKQEIRRLDLAQAEAIQRKDSVALDKLLAEDFTVNSPRNEIVNGHRLRLIRAGAGGHLSLRGHGCCDGIGND